MTGEDDAPERDPLDPFGASTADESNDALDDAAGNETVDDAPSSDAAGASESAPLDDLAASVRDRRERDGDPGHDVRFEEQDVDGIDTDVVWDRLEGDDEGPSVDPDASPGRDTRVVAKDEFCEQCPYFAPPPEVSCSHDGTEILELVDVEQFRVLDCPVVREADRLEDL